MCSLTTWVPWGHEKVNSFHYTSSGFYTHIKPAVWYRNPFQSVESLIWLIWIHTVLYLNPGQFGIIENIALHRGLAPLLTACIQCWIECLNGTQCFTWKVGIIVLHSWRSCQEHMNHACKHLSMYCTNTRSYWSWWTYVFYGLSSGSHLKL